MEEGAALNNKVVMRASRFIGNPEPLKISYKFSILNFKLMTISIRNKDRNHLNFELKTANLQLVLKSPDNITQKHIPKATNPFSKP